MSRWTVVLSAPGWATTLMRVELADLAHERLGGGSVEGGQGGAGQVVRRPEARQADDGERAGRALQQDPHRLARP